MIIKIDYREKELIKLCETKLKMFNYGTKIQLKTENLNIGDILIQDGNDNNITIIERKSINDLAASIKDGRYKEQSYRLNESRFHNHNIIYLIEGDMTKWTPQRYGKRIIDKSAIYSSFASLLFCKGFSVLRTMNLDETAIMILKMVKKMDKEGYEKFYYKNNFEKEVDKNKNSVPLIENLSLNNPLFIKKKPTYEKTYTSVMSSSKKSNITIHNISEIMLMQIPLVSQKIAYVIMKQYKTIDNLIMLIKENNDLLNDFNYVSDKGKIRKLNKNCRENILNYLLCNSE